MRAWGWLIAPVLLAGCLGNGLGADDPPLTDDEVHALAERYLRSERSPGEEVQGDCEWSHDQDTLPERHRCTTGGFTVTYDLGASGARRTYTIATRLWTQECRVNGRVPGKRRLGCWFTARY
jgi:hypothetical protein